MRKRFVVWAAAFTLLLAGCAAGSDGAPQDTGTVTADPVVVRYGISNAWDALMPYNSVSGSNYARIIYDKIYDWPMSMPTARCPRVQPGAGRAWTTDTG